MTPKWHCPIKGQGYKLYMYPAIDIKTTTYTIRAWILRSYPGTSYLGLLFYYSHFSHLEAYGSSWKWKDFPQAFPRGKRRHFIFLQSEVKLLDNGSFRTDISANLKAEYADIDDYSMWSSWNKVMPSLACGMKHQVLTTEICPEG